jgi:hypothetical protein
VPPPEWLNHVGNVGNVAPTETLQGGGKGVENKDYKNPTIPTLPTLPGRALSFKGSILEALISKEYYKQQGKVPSGAAIKTALVTIRGQYIATPSTEFWNRVGVDDKNDWWLDLSDGRYIWITSEGWELLEETIIYFRRHSYQLPLHTPIKQGEGDLFSLLNFINLPDCDSQLLYLICALQALIPDIPKAVLNITGGYGTVKSTGMGAIVEIFDRTSMKEGLPGGLLTMQDNIKELVQNLDHHWVCYFDNLSSLDDEQSDCLSRAVTGASMEKRMLYSDDEDVARRFRRCVGFNSIGMVISKTDLMSRSVVLETKPMLVSQRKTDREIQLEIYKVAGRIFGDALTIVCKAKKMMDEGFSIKDKPRMADFATWGEALSQSMGFKPSAFLNAYYANAEHAMEVVLRTNVVGGLLLDYLEERFILVKDLDFTASELFTVLRQRADDAKYNMKKDFPENPSKLGIVIREIAPNLPGSGIRVTFKRVSKSMHYLFTKFVPTKIDEAFDATAGRGSNNWGVSDLRELRSQLSTLQIEDKPVDNPVESAVSEPVGLQFAREALLGRAELRGDGLEMSVALEFLGKLGLNVSLSVKLVASMMRDGVIFSPRAGWYKAT